MARTKKAAKAVEEEVEEVANGAAKGKPAKKGRGRPAKAVTEEPEENGAEEAVDASDEESGEKANGDLDMEVEPGDESEEEEPVKKSRGRPPKAGVKKGKAKGPYVPTGKPRGRPK